MRDRHHNRVLPGPDRPGQNSLPSLPPTSPPPSRSSPPPLQDFSLGQSFTRGSTVLAWVNHGNGNGSEDDGSEYDDDCSEYDEEEDVGGSDDDGVALQVLVIFDTLPSASSRQTFPRQRPCGPRG